MDTHPVRALPTRAIAPRVRGFGALPAALLLCLVPPAPTYAQSLPATQQPAPAMESPTPAAPVQSPSAAAPQEPAAPAPDLPAPEPAAQVPAPASEVPESAGGQQAPSEGTVQLQEIVVTATRRSEVMSKVPMSVSAFSKDTLEMIGAKDISDVVRYTPGVTIDAEGTNNIAIRGIASSAGASTTGIYIDDTPIQMRTLGFNSDDTLPKTFDLERVEVLRGPQGTLFGAGAEGGAIRYIMTQPQLSGTDVLARTELAFTQGGRESYEAGVAVGSGIVENVLGIRGSIWYRHDGGWVSRLDPNTLETVASDTNYVENYAARLAAKWAVNEDVTITPSMMYQDRQVHDISLYYPFLSNPGANSFRNAQPDPRPDPDHYFLPSIKIESELGKTELISNTSYYTRRDLSGYSGTNYNLGYYQTFNNPPSTGNPTYAPMVNPSYYPLIDGNGVHLPPAAQNYRASAPVTNQQQTFAQEIRLQSSDPKADLTWTAGIFYSKSQQTSIEEINDPMIAQFFQTIFGVDYNSGVFGVPVLPNGDSYFNSNYSRDRQLAVFGEATYALTSRLKATVGLRGSRIDVSYANFTAGPQNFGTTSSTGSQGEKPVTPKFSLAYQADHDNLFYATYAKGFRAGGANPMIPVQACATDLGNLGLAAPPETYNSDSVQSYEVGAKNKLGEHFRIASSLYYIKWQGIQQNVYLSNCGFQFVDNLGNAVSKGGDIQIEFAPSASLDFDLAVGHTDARITSDVGAPGNLMAAQGDAVEGLVYGPAPPWTVALGMQYNFLALDRKSFVRFDYEYQGHSGVTTPTEDPRTGNYDPVVFTPRAYGYVSMRAGTVVDRWSVSAFVENLFNTHPQILDSSDPHTTGDPYNPNPPSVLVTSYTLRPRTMGITATYHL